MRIGDQARLVDRPYDAGGAIRSECLAAALLRDRIEPFPPRRGQVLDVLPFVVDVLAELGEPEQAVDRERDCGIDRRRKGGIVGGGSIRLHAGKTSAPWRTSAGGPRIVAPRHPRASGRRGQ